MKINNELMQIRAERYTAEEVAEYIINSWQNMYDPNDHEYFLWQSVTNHRLVYLGSERAEMVSAKVDYDTEYLKDENPQRFFDENERMDNPDFMEVCQELADKLNANME